MTDFANVVEWSWG